MRRGGASLASGVFAAPPPPTGSLELDAAFAALAAHLAERDGWTVPEWATDGNRKVSSWYPAVLPFDRAEADKDSPPEFRDRGIFITSRSLSRA